jgi:hypothetical protein
LYAATHASQLGVEATHPPAIQIAELFSTDSPNAP